MINLFSKINFDPISNFDHYLHGSVVRQYEEEFADYVGAKYACAANSESSLIFILFNKSYAKFKLPSVLPPVVANAIINGGNTIRFVDNVDWIGKDYEIYENIFDSAQRVDQNQYLEHPNSIMLFSNYPTKPVGGIDGGIIVSNDKSLIDNIRCIIYNGMDNTKESWNRTQKYFGWKMYMSSVQAHVALHSLNQLPIKKEKLDYIRTKYNDAFSLHNTSDHLYRVRVKNNIEALNNLKNVGICCGIHYKPLHTLFPFNSCSSISFTDLSLSEEVGITMLSIPFHEDLDDNMIEIVINEVSPYIET